jgi:hypothetical protein
MTRRARENRRAWRLLASAAAIVVLGVAGFFAWGWMAAAITDGPGALPPCSWPLRVRGKAGPAQVNLIRCYLRDVAERDMSGLRAAAYNDPPPHLTSARLRNSSDASAGLATATFRPNAIDGAYATVHIRYADGARVTVNIWIVNPQAARSWRVILGS